MSDGAVNIWPSGWLPDGRLVFSALSETVDIFTLDANGGEAMPLIATGTLGSGLALAPDGRWLAYSSNETGRSEVYVQRLPELGSRRQISTTGGNHPRWSRDGSELFYRFGNRVMRVPIQTEPVFQPGPSEVLIDGPYSGLRDYDVAPDGRFLMVKLNQAEIGSPARLVLVQNWFEELKRLVPVN